MSNSLNGAPGIQVLAGLCRLSMFEASDPYRGNFLKLYGHADHDSSGKDGIAVRIDDRLPTESQCSCVLTGGYRIQVNFPPACQSVRLLHLL